MTEFNSDYAGLHDFSHLCEDYILIHFCGGIIKYLNRVHKLWNSYRVSMTHVIAPWLSKFSVTVLSLNFETYLNRCSPALSTSTSSQSRV